MSTPVETPPAAPPAAVTVPSAPAAQTTPPTAVEPKQTTQPKELEAKFLRSFGIKPKPPEEKKPDPKPEEKAKEKPAPKEDKPKKEPKSGFDPDLPTPPKTRSENESIRDIVHEAVRGAVEATQPKPIKVEKPPEPELPKGVSKKLELIEILEKENPAYKGLKEKTQEFYKPGGIEEQYRKEWIKENPGKQFNKGDEEHDQFFANNDPIVQVEEDDWDEAREIRATTKAESRAMQSTRAALDEVNHRQIGERSAIKTKQKIDEIALETVAELSDELREKAKEPSKLNTLDEDDPIAEHVLIQAVNRYAPAVKGAIEVFDGIPFNPRDPAHKAVSDLGVELEDALMAMPPDKTIRGNKRFATIQQLQRMTASEQSKYWSVNQDDILKFIKGRVQKEAVAAYGKLNKKKLPSNPSGATVPEVTQKLDEPEERIKSPTVGSSASAPPPGDKNGSGSGAQQSPFVKSFMRR